MVNGPNVPPTGVSGSGCGLKVTVSGGFHSFMKTSGALFVSPLEGTKFVASDVRAANCPVAEIAMLEASLVARREAGALGREHGAAVGIGRGQVDAVDVTALDGDDCSAVCAEVTPDGEVGGRRGEVDVVAVG